VGKIDIYDDLVTELKTAASLPEDLVGQRPSYIDQAGMYSYMAGEHEAAIVVCRRQEFGREPALRAYSVHFREMEVIGAQMRAQRDMLLAALDSHDPSRLGRCEWFSRSCDYRSVCPCAAAGQTTRI